MLQLGCDPELFIERNGKVVGAETVIPANGLSTQYDGKVIIDGVQAELNPAPNTCRANLGNSIKHCLERLQTTLEEKGYQISESGTVKVDKDTLEALAPENQRLGCAPSNNLYKSTATVKVTKNNQYMRSAGGHIHMACFPDPKVIIPILDLFCGNTCVLIDRDPMQALRRKQYGRAGEYRTPKHGFEYRTPSNFWLRSFQLFGLVSNLCRMAYRVSGGTPGKYADSVTFNVETEAQEWLEKHNNRERVEEAINKNDFDLALKNFQVTKEFVNIFIPECHNPEGSYVYPLWPAMLPAFEFFVDKGVDHWWPDKNIWHNWQGLDDTFMGHGYNWEGWFTKTVIPAYKKHKS